MLVCCSTFTDNHSLMKPWHMRPNSFPQKPTFIIQNCFSQRRAERQPILAGRWGTELAVYAAGPPTGATHVPRGPLYTATPIFHCPSADVFHHHTQQ